MGKLEKPLEQDFRSLKVESKKQNMIYRCKNCNRECVYSWNRWQETEHIWKNSVAYRKDGYCSACCGNESNMKKNLPVRYCSCGRRFTSTTNLPKPYCPVCDNKFDKYRTSRCDWCGKEFKANESLAQKPLSFCSRKCEYESSNFK